MTLGEDAAAALRARVNSDGGFAASIGRSEPEPTALAALALADDPVAAGARRWLLDRQRRSGTWAPVDGSPRPTVVSTALGALAVGDGEPRTRAVAALAQLRAPKLEGQEQRGWGWAPRTFGWVEPTAWTLLTIRRLHPSSAGPLGDGERVLAERECVGGGWNYGNRTVLGTDLEPYVQTTAVALIALQGSGHQELVSRGLHVLRTRWRDERGGLSTATTLAAFRLGGEPAEEITDALHEDLDDIIRFGDTGALAWTALASGPGLEALRVDR